MKQLLTLLAAAIILIGMQARLEAGKNADSTKSRPPATAVLNKDGPVPPVAAEAPNPAVEEKKRDEFWTVTAVGVTEEDARKVAMLKARDKVLAFLEQQHPPVTWQPSLEYLQTSNFFRDEAITFETKNDEDGHEVNTKYWCTLKVVAPATAPALYYDILKQERQLVQVERQWLAGKVLAVLVAIVLALGGYFYLDEATKGFYTVLLRLGALTLVGAVGLVVWFVMH